MNTSPEIAYAGCQVSGLGFGWAWMVSMACRKQGDETLMNAAQAATRRGYIHPANSAPRVLHGSQNKIKSGAMLTSEAVVSNARRAKASCLSESARKIKSRGL